ncbi:MAG: two-component system response regulator [Verrucomicrobia bacterium]|nr:MAG: two-component system response regulator [Verrucomicrobiota bacterium]
MKTPLILLVEDSDDDAFFFERELEKSEVSCSLQHVGNGVEAVEFLRNASETGELPQTIFLDLKMPVLNGFEVLDWMRTQTFAIPIQVIVLSGSDHDDDKARAAQLGAVDYLVKPIRVSDLHRILEHVCPPQTGVAG